MLIPAVYVFSLCSWFSGLAQNFEQLLISRVLLGLAEGPCWSVIMALVEESTGDEHRARNMGIVNSAGPFMGAAVAPVFATQIASAFGWRWGFFGAAIPGIVCGTLVLLFVKEGPREHVVGGSSGTCLLADAISLLANGNLWLCLICAFAFVTWLMVFTVFAPLYVTSVMHQEERTAGFLLSAAGLGGAFWSFFGTGIADRIGRKPALLIFSALSVLATLILMVESLYRTPSWPWDEIVQEIQVACSPYPRLIFRLVHVHSNGWA